MAKQAPYHSLGTPGPPPLVSIAVTAEPPIAAANVAEDCRAAGLEVAMQQEASEQFFQAVLRATPGLILAVSASPSDMLLESAALLTKVAPCPFVLFTTDASPAKIERAAAAGIHSYVIDGYAPRRLRGIVQVALARFQHQQRQGERLSDLERDLRDRKQLERAKGLLMRSRGLTEEAAFALMRSLAMRRRLRLANVAEAIIAVSVGADAVNRSGQIRMLAQRLARCHVQLAFDVHAEAAGATLRDSRERLDLNVATLRRTVGDRGCGPDLDRIEARWAALKKALLPATAATVETIDALAEALTADAETLTAFLQTSGLVTNLRVINLAGRQRMLSQRIGKLCLLLALDTKAGAAATAVRAAHLQQAAREFGDALGELERMPIRTPDIERGLHDSAAQWASMLPIQRSDGSISQVVEASERLLTLMEALTEAYEQAAQILIGDRIEPFEPPEVTQAR